ncbi:MAG: ABC transporter permease [Gammaproteobacteria bacterium]|nr:ABC transporter permease [Gammaproteobacteria bacterium]
MLLKVAFASLLNRRFTVLLTTLAIAVSVFVMLGVEHIRTEARQSFSKTVSGVDLIIGARTGQVNLLLYSVFHIGNASNNISWESYQALTKRPLVAWHIPLSLGDSHKGHRVLGTTTDYFKHYKYAKKQPLNFAQGEAFNHVFDAVIGAGVAKKLSYQLGDQIALSHGVADVSFSKHDDKPFTIVGILNATGTPVDQTIHVKLEAIEAIHQDWPGAGSTTNKTSDDMHNHTGNELTPGSITAFMVGLTSRVATFHFQREVNNYREEALSAIIPGVALTQLWQMMGIVEKVLALISLLVLVASLLGMVTLLLASMKERTREITVLRTIGAHASFIFLLIELEALLITFMGIVTGMVLLTITLATTQSWISSHYGLVIDVNIPGNTMLYYFTGILSLAAVLALLPSIMAYRYSLTKW